MADSWFVFEDFQWQTQAVQAAFKALQVVTNTSLEFIIRCLLQQMNMLQIVGEINLSKLNLNEVK